MVEDVKDFDIQTLKLRVVGVSPLICRKWDYTNGCKIGERPAQQTPEEAFRAALHILPDGRYGFPTIAFKNAAVSACGSSDTGITKLMARQAFCVVGEWAVLEGEPVMRGDVVKIAGVSGIRYGAEFKRWATEITVRLNAKLVYPERLWRLFEHAGMVSGIGLWRPERDGSYGRFKVTVV